MIPWILLLLLCELPLILLILLIHKILPIHTSFSNSPSPPPNTTQLPDSTSDSNYSLTSPTSSSISSRHILNSSINSPVIPVTRHNQRQVVPSTKLADFVNIYVPHHNNSSLPSPSSSDSQSFAVNSILSKQ